MRSTHFVAATLLLFVPFISAIAFAQTDCPDQFHETNTYEYLWINGDITIAQTFTTGLAGRLHSVDILIGKFGDPAGPLIIELRPTVGYLPAEDIGSVLASRTLAAAEITNTDYITLDVTAAAVDVSPGDVYAIVARSPQSGTNWDYDIYTAPWIGGGGYGGGLSVFQAYDSTWQVGLDDNGNTLDFGFHTYIDCTTPVEQTTWSAVKALFR